MFACPKQLSAYMLLVPHKPLPCHKDLLLSQMITSFRKWSKFPISCPGLLSGFLSSKPWEESVSSKIQPDQCQWPQPSCQTAARRGTNQFLSKYWVKGRKKNQLSKPKSSSSNVTADKALTWKRVCCQEGIWAPRCARGAGGFGQFFQGGPKASPSPSCSDQQGCGEWAGTKVLIQHWHCYNRCLGSNCWEKGKRSFHTPWIPALWAWKADRASLQYPDTVTILPIRDLNKTTNPFPADNLIAIRWW